MSEASLLQDSIIYLGAAVVCVPIASRLKLGSVLGYLAAGCLIGPALGLVTDSESTLHFAEIGVVLMLFVIGLELDPKKLWAMRSAVFGGGGLQLASCAAVLFVLLSLLGLGWKVALVAALAMGLSSTAVCMQTMAERNLTRTPVGQRVFGVLLFQDIAAIPLLAAVPLLAGSSGADGSGGGNAAIIAVATIVGVVGVGRYLTRPAMRIIAGTGIREVFTAFALLVVLGVAALMQFAGVSMALGAFLAGVLLASSEYRHALEADIEPFKGLLMGLFFIAVGMTIDFELLSREPLLILGLVLGFQLAKGLMLRLIAGRVGVAQPSRWLFAALLAQGGEFAFVVFGVARQGGLQLGEWDGRLTLTVALSMALTPLLLMVERKLNRPAPSRDSEADAIEDNGALVILAGFGRFGQIVGRLLFANGITATVLDHDPEQIETIRRFGFRVYYGDATRVDLLHAAGAARATVIVNAIDDPATSVHLVENVQAHFPGVTIVARARNVEHYLQLRALGVDIIERETFESALSLARDVLVRLGVGPYEAREHADRFRRLNLVQLEEMLPHRSDEKRRIEIARSARKDLERQLEIDRAQLDNAHGVEWNGEKGSDREDG